MWVNFKANVRRDSGVSQKHSFKSSTSLLNQPNGNWKVPTRENSTRSFKSTSSVSNLQKKIEEFCMQNQTSEWQKEQEYKNRRIRRNQIKKQVDSKSKLRIIRKLYIPSGILLVCGIIFSFGAAIDAVGEGTFLWTKRDIFIMVGPVLTVLGIVFLLVIIGLENQTIERLKGTDVYKIEPQFIHPDFNMTKHHVSRQASEGSSSVPGHQLQGNKVPKWFLDCDESFLCSSLSSTTSFLPPSQSIDLISRWEKAMTISVDGNGNDHDTNNARRELHHTPIIEITETDDTSSASACDPDIPRSGTDQLI